MLFYPYFWLRPLFGLANLRTDATHTHRNVLFIDDALCQTTTFYVNKVCGRITRLSGISKLTTAHVRRVRRVRGVRRCAWCVLVCVVCAVCFQVDLLYNTLQLRLT